MRVTAYRLASWDTPLWASPNRRPSRFVSAGKIVQYWSLHPLTPWAEVLRYHDVRDPDEARELFLRPWAAELDLPEGTIEVGFDTATEHGIDAADLVAEDHRRCQEWVAGLDVPAMLVPSAALPGTTNVVLFGARVRTRFGEAPVDRALDVPCDPIAHLANVVEDLLASVRWRGAPHAGYEAWRSGDPPVRAPAVTVSRRP